MHACVEDVAAGPNQPIPDYIGDTGIPSLAFVQATDWRLDIVTPYAVMPLAQINQTVAVIWYHNLLLGPRMQVR